MPEELSSWRALAVRHQFLRPPHPLAPQAGGGKFPASPFGRLSAGILCPPDRRRGALSGGNPDFFPHHPPPRGAAHRIPDPGRALRPAHLPRPPLFLTGKDRRHPLPLFQRPDQCQDADRLRCPQHHQHLHRLCRRPGPDGPHQPPAHPVRSDPLPRHDLRGEEDQRFHVPPLEKGPGRAGPPLQQG